METKYFRLAVLGAIFVTIATVAMAQLGGPGAPVPYPTLSPGHLTLQLQNLRYQIKQLQDSIGAEGCAVPSFDGYIPGPDASLLAQVGLYAAYRDQLQMALLACKLL